MILLEKKKVEKLVLENAKIKDQQANERPVSKDTVDAMNKEKDQLFEQLKLARQEIAKLKGSKEDQKRKIDNLNTQVQDKHSACQREKEKCCSVESKYKIAVNENADLQNIVNSLKEQLIDVQGKEEQNQQINAELKD